MKINILIMFVVAAFITTALLNQKQVPSNPAITNQKLPELPATNVAMSAHPADPVDYLSVTAANIPDNVPGYSGHLMQEGEMVHYIYGESVTREHWDAVANGYNQKPPKDFVVRHFDELPESAVASLNEINDLNSHLNQY